MNTGHLFIAFSKLYMNFKSYSADSQLILQLDLIGINWRVFDEH